MPQPLFVAPGVVLPGSELTWTAVRSSGAGGQNVNKVSTKVKLCFDFGASSVLPPSVKERLRRRGASAAGGELVVTCDETRSQTQNLEIARNRLVEIVRAALVTPKKRRPTRPSRASKQRRLDAKRKTGEKKRARRTEE